MHFGCAKNGSPFFKVDYSNCLVLFAVQRINGADKEELDESLKKELKNIPKLAQKSKGIHNTCYLS